jgi:hypothetical protein
MKQTVAAYSENPGTGWRETYLGRNRRFPERTERQP